MSTDEPSYTRKSTLALVSGGGAPETPRVVSVDAAPAPEAPRPRRNSIEAFNQEMAVLDRPLEGDVEYIDEPRPSHLRTVGVVALIAIVGVGGALFVSRHRGAADAQANAAEATTPPAAPAPAAAAVAPAAVLATNTPAVEPAPAPAPAEAIAPEAAAPEAAEPEGDDAEADESAVSDAAAPRLRPSKGSWAKVRGKAAHVKPARATSGKSTTVRRTTTTTTRHTVVAKRVVTRHR
jgi:hypothetical protein